MLPTSWRSPKAHRRCSSKKPILYGNDLAPTPMGTKSLMRNGTSPVGLFLASSESGTRFPGMLGEENEPPREYVYVLVGVPLGLV